MAADLIIFSVLEDLIQELAHMEVLYVLIDKFNDGKCAIVEVAKNIHQTLKVIFSCSCFEIYHAVRSKKRVTIEAFDPLLLFMLAILVEDLRYQCKINHCVASSFLIKANVLELQVAMCISKFMNNFQLRNDLHANL